MGCSSIKRIGDNWIRISVTLSQQMKIGLIRTKWDVDSPCVMDIAQKVISPIADITCLCVHPVFVTWNLLVYYDTANWFLLNTDYMLIRKKSGAPPLVAVGWLAHPTKLEVYHTIAPQRLRFFPLLIRLRKELNLTEKTEKKKIYFWGRLIWIPSL